ncbi:aminopeptidase N [Oceanicola granulosus HTCC2516]|uniref:Aminopeptidase N n=1 Tax=Oceanicola granulosus (strain ATCC BAA-861 / DSM 15982 / KCTC 12143 / HTCC2516) TaxID=314256 RepID=Q2CIH3_OCEGH|nr:aminopeptidase N [Oceanicola granulosus]EAR52616.1 aminopeptidase N [Oceanicola granulosus HTCC2516]
MSTDERTIHLKDYAPFPWLVERVDLTFRLSPDATRVLSRVAFRPNPDSAGGPFFLHGEGLRLISAAVDGTLVTPEVTPEGLTCAVPDGPFLWECEVEIAPSANTALEGLYMAGDMFTTQCEAEGFRKITYYPDRPDVMAPFRVRIESDLPVLLSNGNPVASGTGFAEWDDPWPKPAYLFALVAGELVAVRDSFTTRSGREVALAVWVRPGDEGRCDWALESLKASMAWDEAVYGREYDLDIFNIVAVDDFNAGAMENKGLNIFNSALVLASPETATDRDYERIEAVIAHEYFHNWTGNRVTCRDWFQLCLKEGLTVYRDQQFTSDTRSAPVKRIEDALLLRSRQFREDGGPLAHPVRPESFVEINNFYTITVYEKGAELVGMLKRLVGDNAWRAGCDLYFERHDGQAVTIEDWLAAFSDVTGRDLSQFQRWYAQAGTPRLAVEEAWDGAKLTLTFRQATPPTPGQPEKAPVVIPVALGLLHPDGGELMGTTLVEVNEAEQSVTYDVADLARRTGREVARPVPSVLRGFSAPVALDYPRSTETHAFLLAHDTDPFNRWEAGRSLARTVLAAEATGARADRAPLFAGYRAVLQDPSLDAAFKALVLALPSEDDMAQTLHAAGHTPDPLAIHAAAEAVRDATARELEPLLAQTHRANQVPGPYRPDAASAGRRSLANSCLALLSRTDGGERARRQFAEADNMTQSLAALASLLTIGDGLAELATFGEHWADDRLVMDKWFALQVACAAPEDAAATAERLTRHPAFHWKTPNRFRAVFSSLAGNAAGFHAPSGAAYELLADWLIRLDPVNPQVAARSVAAFDSWPRYDAARQERMRAALGRIAATPGLSRDTAEMVSRILGD